MHSDTEVSTPPPPPLPLPPAPPSITFLQPRRPAQPPQSNNFNRFAVRKVHSKNDISPKPPEQPPRPAVPLLPAPSITQTHLHTHNKDIVNNHINQKQNGSSKDLGEARERHVKHSSAQPILSLSLPHASSSLSDSDDWFGVPPLGGEAASNSIHKLMRHVSRKDVPQTYKQNLEDTMILQHLVALKIAFEKADTDKSGGLDMDEFVEAFGEVLGKDLNEQQLQQLFMKIDANSDGMVSWDEFSTFMILDNQNSRNLSQHENSVELVRQIFEDKNDPRVYHREAIQRIVPVGKRDMYVTTSRDGTLRWWKPAGLRHLHTSTHGFFNTPPGGATPRITPRYAQESAHSWITDAVYMPGTNKLAISSMDRKISFYDVWTLEEQGYHITNLPNVPLSMFHILDTDHSTLLIGDDHGCVKTFTYSLEDINIQTKDNDQWILSAIQNDEKRPTERKIHDDWVNRIRFYSELNSMVTASSDKTIRFTDIERGKIVRVLEGHSRAVMTFDFSPLHNLLASGGAERDVLLWNPWISRPLGALIGHNAAILDIVISETDNLLISLSADRLVKVWDVRTHTCLQTFKRKHEKSRPEDMISTLYHDTSRDWIVSGDEKLSVYLICRHLRRGKDVKSHEFPITAALYNANFQQAVTGDSNSLLTVWNAVTGEKLARFPEVHGKLEITAMAFDNIPDDEGSGRRLISGARDGALKIWNFNTGQKLKDMLKTEPWEVTAIKYIRQVKLGRKLVIAVGWNRHVCVWQEITNQKRAEIFTELVGHTDDVLGVDFCEPNILIGFESLEVWNIDSGYPRFTLSLNKEDGRVGSEELIAIEKVMFLHKKKVSGAPPLLSCGNDGCIRIWDVEVGKQIAKIQANHSKGESLVVMSTDSMNTILLTGDSKGYIEVWDISEVSVDDPGTYTREGFKSIGYWRAHAQNLVCIEFMEKWKTIFTASTDCTARLWTLDGIYIGTFGQEVLWKISDPKTYKKEKPSDVADDEEISDYKAAQHRRPNSSLLSDIITTYKERDKASKTRIIPTQPDAPLSSLFPQPPKPATYQPSFSSSFENNYSDQSTSSSTSSTPFPPSSSPNTTFARRKLIPTLNTNLLHMSSPALLTPTSSSPPTQRTARLAHVSSSFPSPMQNVLSFSTYATPASPRVTFNRFRTVSLDPPEVPPMRRELDLATTRLSRVATSSFRSTARYPTYKQP